MASDPIPYSRRQAMEEYLRGYALSQRLLRLSANERRLFGRREDDLALRDSTLLRGRMFGIRQFVTSMPNGEEKMFLYFRYVRGESMSRCADLMERSRSSLYRLHDRAIAAAVRHAEGMEGTEAAYPPVWPVPPTSPTSR